MGRRSNELGGLVMVYGVVPTPALLRELSPEQEEEARRLGEQLRARADASKAPKTVEQAAAALAEAVRAEGAAADRHRQALAQAEEAHRLALARVAKLAEAHVAAREATAAAKAKVVELARQET